MDAKTYRVKSMREALDLIREELGPEASLLHCRRVRRRGVSGWLTRKTELEVVASLSEAIPSRFPPEAERWLSKSTSVLHDAVISDVPVRETAAREKPTSFFEDAVPLSQARGMESLRSQLRDMGLQAGLADDVVERLWQQGFQFADETVSDAVGQALVLLAEALPLGGELNCQPGMSHWVAMVGPCGAGKTTTLAKLAAQFTRERGMSVAIVKVGDETPVSPNARERNDVDQALNAYADLLGIPIVAIGSPAEMTAQFNGLTEKYDLVLLDTPGWDHEPDEMSRHVQEILQVAKPDEVQCVVSALGDSISDLSSLPQFHFVRPDGLILTHLDETPAFHQLWPALQEIALPVNYLTHGHGVPDDFVAASVEQLVLWLQRSLHCWDERPRTDPSVQQEARWAA
jgi:flagellar biosynthesis protein FlhF